MTGTESLAKSIAKSIACAINQYKEQHRKPPEKIFAELTAFYALKLSGTAQFDAIGGWMTFLGVPVEPIGKEGLEIYLCGERVEIHLRKEEEL